MKKEIIVAVICLVGSVILYSILGHIEEERAANFPKVIIIIMGILSALLLAQSVLIGKTQKTDNREHYPWARFFLLFVIIVVYLAVMETIGFYLSAFLFFVGICLTLGRADLTVRRAAFWVGSSALFTAVLFVLFKVLLEVQTPRGVFI